ncbi:metallophosphoesterase [Granulosicoccus antarcticus]|uniref:Calcineurin-like phosphoesterase domain-containing protein n=1 Tax=Granulosicoccus antarcticus IMCC3135 TaxID=1192854 RepID=A0A2Z2NV97_9GAMM|nr:metallophosphoesterase [Granulosicoccus antarcticus]ASJ73951.1 hypothetical protein IMCC3135_19360 [Granulosicoccus antarcticus IMCC3135]
MAIFKFKTAFALLALTSFSLNAPALAATKVAFVGDQGTGGNAQAVLSLVSSEGADLLLLQGDLGYYDNTASDWEANLVNELGANFPVLTVVGNHENHEWPAYQRYIEQRIDRVPGLSCTGSIGVKAACTFNNIEVVQVAPGVREVAGVAPDDNYEQFLRDSLSSSQKPWRICSWHKNQNAMQTGSKSDSTGWGVFDACLDAGAMIAMGHEHAYSRTYLLSNFESQSIVHKNSEMTLEPGKSFAFVSGLGGHDIRSQKRGGDWFASIYTASQGATHGALFCSFEDTTAECYFKAIDGSVPDQFSLTLGVQPQLDSHSVPVPSDSDSDAGPTAATSDIDAGFVFSRTDKQALRWIDRDSSGNMASTWINESCAQKMGGVSRTGNWKTLISIAPNTDGIANPCSASTASNPLSSPLPSISNENGFVFSRTDTTEFRWVSRDSTGGMGNIWINKACADRLGGASQSGDWRALNGLAPGFDAIANPCNEPASTVNSPFTTVDEGYVFSRTDKKENRWIERDANGVWGSIWIDKECADRLGGPTATGDWKTLNQEAPGFDAIRSPC